MAHELGARIVQSDRMIIVVRAAAIARGAWSWWGIQQRPDQTLARSDRGDARSQPPNQAWQVHSIDPGRSIRCHNQHVFKLLVFDLRAAKFPSRHDAHRHHSKSLSLVAFVHFAAHALASAKLSEVSVITAFLFLFFLPPNTNQSEFRSNQSQCPAIHCD